MYELLAPAGNKACALAAISSGADAIYLGYSAFSARAGAENFDFSALREIIARAHLFGVKVYVAMNTLIRESEREEFISTLVAVHNLGADAVLLQDLFLGRAIHEQYPDIVLHLSTQAGVNNVYGARLAKKYGFSRVVLARETSLQDIRAVAAEIETEVFVQGALCTCFSGQCYLSSFIGGNSGNRGRCKQPCRKKYTLNAGEKKENYALSLSDLNVGEKVFDLLDAGVLAFKIEGRMRRPEYVAAAVRYYKKILNGQNAGQELSDLKRTYNRGNYTQGLAFGQDKRFLSRAVQGHIGEKVGVVKVVGGKYFVESAFRPSSGDGFKLLRGGEEIGGAGVLSSDRRGFYLSTRARLKNGDGVFLTTDTALNARLLAAERKRPLSVSVSVGETGRLIAVGGGVSLSSGFVLEPAKSLPMSAMDVKNCFAKTGDYPFAVQVEVTLPGEYFVPKSRLNAFRRAFYAAVYEKWTQNDNTPYVYHPQSLSLSSSAEGREMPETDKKEVPMPAPLPRPAVIGTDFSGVEAEIYILKPKNYADPAAYTFMRKGGEVYLYLPPFLSGEDLRMVERHVAPFDGIYAEGYYGIECAGRWGKKLFAGTGFHIANAVSARAAEQFAFYALSKELDFSEQRALAGKNAFVLSVGALKVMDLIYCPFEKKCASCEKRELYTLTDEGGRVFSLRRYQGAGGCRFELYNCAPLFAPQSFANPLIDLSTLPMPVAKGIAADYDDTEKIKEFLPVFTSGHSKKSVL